MLFLAQLSAPKPHKRRRIAKQSLKTKVHTDGSRRVYKNHIQVDGETFSIGDNVYVVLDERFIAQGGVSDDDIDDAYICAACGSHSTRKSPLVECSKCMCGHHLHCLDPPLKEIPEVRLLPRDLARLSPCELFYQTRPPSMCLQGNWLCPQCAAGKPPRKRAITSAREHFLQQRGLGMARIEALWTVAGSKEPFFLGRWYYTPEETHVGRQHHHAAREVFLSPLQDEASLSCVLRRTSVISMDSYLRGGDGDIGNDAFVCEYEYDFAWQRFRRLSWDELTGEARVEDGALSDSDDDEDRDANFTMADALRSEYGEDFGLHRGAGGRRGKRKGQQGGHDFGIQLGTRTIPDHVRSGNHSAMRQVANALALAATPQSLPCREAENASIRQFVEEVLVNGESAVTCRKGFMSKEVTLPVELQHFTKCLQRMALAASACTFPAFPAPARRPPCSKSCAACAAAPSLASCPTFILWKSTACASPPLSMPTASCTKPSLANAWALHPQQQPSKSCSLASPAMGPPNTTPS